MRFAAALVLLTLLSSCATTPDAPAALSPDSDEFQIRATMLAVYNVISGPAGRRDWDRFEALFAPGAQLVLAGVNGDSPTVVMTTKDYIARTKPNFDAKGWFERPIATRVEQYGDIAHAWSTYEAREASDQEKATARGVNSFELVKINGAWKVQSLLWQSEDAAHPIPAQFLSGR